jgi:hypothetical protein
MGEREGVKGVKVHVRKHEEECAEGTVLHMLECTVGRYVCPPLLC